MRWEKRFEAIEADLAVHADGEQMIERDRAIDDLRVDRTAEVRWAERCLGRPVTLTVAGIGTVRGELAMATRDWVLLHHDLTTDWVVSVLYVLGARAETSVPAAAQTEVQRRTTWRQAWSAFVRDRDLVTVIRTDGSTVRGVPARAGEDYAELGGELVPYAAVVAVRCPR